MGFDDLINQGKQLFEEGKEKVTDFVESDKGKELFEDGKAKVTDFLNSDKGEEVSDQVIDGAADLAKKVAPDSQDATIDDLRNKADGAVGTQ